MIVLCIEHMMKNMYVKDKWMILSEIMIADSIDTMRCGTYVPHFYLFEEDMIFY